LLAGGSSCSSSCPWPRSSVPAGAPSIGPSVQPSRRHIWSSFTALVLVHAGHTSAGPVHHLQCHCSHSNGCVGPSTCPFIVDLAAAPPPSLHRFKTPIPALTAPGFVRALATLVIAESQDEMLLLPSFPPGAEAFAQVLSVRCRCLLCAMPVLQCIHHLWLPTSPRAAQCHVPTCWPLVSPLASHLVWNWGALEG